MRYFIELAYNGTKYHGWQSQPNAVSVQETLSRALSILLRTPIEIIGAGRTDTGVHARQMFAHFDHENELDKTILVSKLNSFLPKDIAIYAIHSVPDNAHARFDASSRAYEYHIHSYKDPFIHPFSWYFFHPLDVKAMNTAATIMMEYNDFECFSKTNTDVNTFICKISEARWVQKGNRLIFYITADRFLRNMVRAIVGTLINIGIGKQDPESIRKVIESKNRSQAGFSVPAHGLYLTHIQYPYISPSKNSYESI